MIVLAIIGLLTGLALPHLKGLTRSNVMASANQQLLDDVALARQRAINGRSVVCMVFMPPVDPTQSLYSFLNVTQQNQILAWQYTAYTMMAERTVGDQPGRPFKRYLSTWKHLPDGVFIAAPKFSMDYSMTNGNGIVKNVLAFDYKTFPYPTGDNGKTLTFPYIAFDPQGHMVVYDAQQGRFVPYPRPYCIIPLARGSILLDRDANGNLLWTPATPTESGGNNSQNSDTYDQIEIDAFSGRALLDRKSL
jgi:type II secretory pathway pseudopilin PulG